MFKNAIVPVAITIHANILTRRMANMGVIWLQEENLATIMTTLRLSPHLSANIGDNLLLQGKFVTIRIAGTTRTTE